MPEQNVKQDRPLRCMHGWCEKTCRCACPVEFFTMDNTEKTEACFKCKKSLSSGPLKTYLDQQYHKTCFTCKLCDQEITNRFRAYNHDIYCNDCFVQKFYPQCTKCNKYIEHDCMRAMGRTWHGYCFCCAVCGARFSKVRFYVHDEIPYCYDHYEENRKKT